MTCRSPHWQVLTEKVGSTTTKRYVWSPVYVDALILRDRDTNADGTLDERLWVQQDANWNVTALVDGSGAVVERYTYDPYGVRTVYDASWSSIGSSAYSWSSGYQGTFYDSIAGLNPQRERWYSPTLGRWVTMDPIGYGAGDADLYRFVGNNPLARVDPLGLDSIPLIVGDLPPSNSLQQGFQNSVASTIPNSQLGLGIGGSTWAPSPEVSAPANYVPTLDSLSYGVLGTPPLALYLASPPIPTNMQSPFVGSPTENVGLYYPMQFASHVVGSLIPGLPEYSHTYPSNCINAPALSYPYFPNLGLPGPGGGNHQFFQMTNSPLCNAVGTNGAQPCVALIIQYPGQNNCPAGAVFHFDPNQDANSTIMQYNWPQGSHAVIAGGQIAGGDGEYASASAFWDIMYALHRLKIPFKIVNSPGVFMKPNGTWSIQPSPVPNFR